MLGAQALRTKQRADKKDHEKKKLKQRRMSEQITSTTNRYYALSLFLNARRRIAAPADRRDSAKNDNRINADTAQVRAFSP